MSKIASRDRSQDIVIGQVVGGRTDSAFRLSPTDQQYHATIWGRTGSGKSKLLQSLFLQHLSHGHGVCLIDPHHDLSFDTLAYLVEKGFFERADAFERLIYLDWGNGSFVPFNVLAAPYPPQTVALQMLEAMLRVWPELRRAPAFQTLFLSSVVVLIANKLPITSLHDLLSDTAFRQQCLAKIDDPLILQTFARFGKMSGQAQEAGSALRRAFLLCFNDASRLSLGQPDCLLNLRRLMDEGRSLIVNLGNIQDQETRRLIGALLLVQIEQAALSRADLSPSRRRPWTVLLDEWPSFAATDATLGSILDQTRKYGLRLYLAAQSTAQVSSERLAGALENCKLTIAFGLGRESAVEQSRQLVTAQPRQEGGPWSFFAPSPPPPPPIREQFELLTQELQILPPQLAYVKRGVEPPVKVRTLSVRDAKPPRAELAGVLATYRQRYQRSREAAAAHLRPMPQVHQSSSIQTPFTLFARESTSSSFLDESHDS